MGLRVVEKHRWTYIVMSSSGRRLAQRDGTNWELDIALSRDLFGDVIRLMDRDWRESTLMYVQPGAVVWRYPLKWVDDIASVLSEGEIVWRA